MALKTKVPQEIVDKIISFQWKDAKDAVHLHKEVEISGLGKFVLSPVRVKSKIKRIEASIDKMKDPAQKEDMQKALIFLKTKYEIYGDIRGVEESSVPSGEDEGSDSGDGRQEN